MSEPRKNHLTIDGGQPKDDEPVASYKPIPEADTEFRSSKASLHKSKEKVDEAEEKLLEKEDEAKITTRVDMADAKYVVGDHRNGDAKIELDANKRQFSGLTKEELMRYADDPFWVRLRWAMFILFWALWLCMLAGAIIIIVRAPKCAPPPPKAWFQEQALADVSDKEWTDVESDMDLLKRSNVGGVFTHTAICGNDAYEVLKTPPPACLEQFKQFVTKAKDNGVKVIVDLVANWVVATHEWFALSENRTAPYEDFFIWGKPNGFNGTVPNPPNNWVSLTNGSAWQFSEQRKEFYLHQYGGGKADLNFTNPAVVKKFDEVLKTWMQAGAAGVRLLNAREVLVSSALTDEQPLAATDQQPAGAPAVTDYGFYRHKHASDRPELDDLLAHFSQVVDDHYARPGANESVFTLQESGSRPELYLLARSLGTLRPPSAAPLDAAEPALLVNKTRERLGPHTDKWPALQLWTSDADAGDDLAAFAYLLPATPVVTLAQLENFNKTGDNELERLVSLRSDASIQHGNTSLAEVFSRNTTDPLVAVARWKPGHTGYVAVLNTRDVSLRANLSVSALSALPDQLTVHYVSAEVALLTNYTNNKQVPSDDVWVPAQSAVVLSFVPRTAAEK